MLAFVQVRLVLIWDGRRLQRERGMTFVRITEVWEACQLGAEPVYSTSNGHVVALASDRGACERLSEAGWRFGTWQCSDGEEREGWVSDVGERG